MLIDPAWIVSSPFIQRNSVLLPEPERPMTAMISPASTSSETSRRTLSGPKLFETSRMSTSGIESPLQGAAPLGQWEAHKEVEGGNRHIDGERLERARGCELSLARELHE